LKIGSASSYRIDGLPSLGARRRDHNELLPVKPENMMQSHRLPLRHGVRAVLALICGGLLLAPHFWHVPATTPLLLSAAAALVAYLGSQRLSDAIVLAMPPLAGFWVDADVGSPALLAACLVPYLLTMRPRFAAVAGSALVALLLTGIGLKERFAGTTLTWQDMRFFFLQFNDNVGVMASQPTLLWCAGGASVLATLACFLAWRWNPPGRPAGWLAPATAAILAVLLIAHSGGLVARKASRLSTAGDSWVIGEGQLARPVLTFFATAFLEPRWEVGAADTRAFRRESQTLLSGGAMPGPADIVVFLQESQFNPAAIAGCPATLCALDAFRAREETIARGPLQVHTFGGGTWKSEFAFETGVPHTAFGPAGDFAPFNIAPGTHRSFARSLKAAGYRTAALYPTRGGMMNGRAAYAAYGFDEFYDASDLGLSGAYDTPDALVHAAARKVLARERNRDQPVFLFVLTIFNHAEHGVRMERVPAGLVAEASRAFGSSNEAQSVADYVWRTREFERELSLTRSAVLGAHRPAVFAWFGDHQPPFANAVTLRQRMQSLPTESGTVPARYQTWYEVTSNKPHPVEEQAPRALDIVFLPGLLAQAAGASLDDWLAANVSAREQCGGLLEACRAPAVREAYLSYLRGDLQEFELP
jgi:hypothetical protein